jgi:hypothetical protein
MQLQRTAGNAAVSRLLGRAKGDGRDVPVQRLVGQTSGQINETLNMIDPFIPGTDFGTTFVILNGMEHPPTDLAKAMAPVNLTVKPQPSGRALVSLYSEPFNIMSYRMDLPSAGAWKKTVSKNEAGYRLKSDIKDSEKQRCQPVLDKYIDKDGDTEIEAHGAPDDQRFRQLVREHEQVHLTHIGEAYKGILKTWDAQIRARGSEGTPFEASSPATAQSEFYRSLMPPDEVGRQIQHHFKQNGLLFHDTREGGAPVIDDVYETGLFKKTLHFRWRHPLS